MACNDKFYSSGTNIRMAMLWAQYILELRQNEVRLSSKLKTLGTSKIKTEQNLTKPHFVSS